MSVTSNVLSVNCLNVDKCCLDCVDVLNVDQSKFKVLFDVSYSVHDPVSVNVCQDVNAESIEVKAGHYELISFGGPGKCVMDIEVTKQCLSFIFHCGIRTQLFH